ncbi:putative disease resistance protein RGA3 [Tasmannia lanceolata]|uniref:putative disease resistance protein RGA3 n=1 Tax=Tasmannia lanceolata TaxID=3420 RepID=UPI00406413BE
MAEIAKVFVSPVLDALIVNLKESALEEIKSILGFEEELEKLESTVTLIQGVVEDAEEKQVSSKAVRKWLGKLKNIAYDADDLLDDVATEARRSALMCEIHTSKRQKIVHSISSFFSSNNPLLYKRGIARKMREIRERFDVMANERKHLNLHKTDGGRPLQRETSSFIDESDVIGRQVEKDKIIQLLVSSSSDDDKLYSVIPIVGMGGVGKTTLAQFVYNDHRVKTHFGLKAWTCVSDNFDVRRITNDIIESATKSKCHLSTLDAIQGHLQVVLKDQRFLIVLDDVWYENQIHSHWDSLRAPFGVGAKGSKIIITTRDERVARTMATIPSHHLEVLPDDDCWELFARRAFAGGISNAHPELEEIGRQIVKKCNGLPLAVKTLGGILSSKRNVSEWGSILTSEIWRDDRNEILPALRLSYRHLPTNQKQCFAYSAVFPKDHWFEKDVLVRQWMAAGFIQPKGSILLEDIGGEIFDDLFLKSFFQYSDEWDGTSVYVMHDLMHDLAESISGDECFRLEDGTSQTIPEMVHHLSWIDIKEGSMSLEALKKFKRLRTLRLKAPSSIDNQILNDTMMELRCLRVLNLNVSAIDKLPDSIVHLKHLRYLHLTGTKIDRLPESVTSLCNLQTLCLRSCKDLKVLPDSISHLKHLRYLDLSYTEIDGLPESVSSLCNLQRLGLKSCKNLKGLPDSISHLKHLRYLDLSYTEIDVLPESVSSLCNLQRLGLRSCKNLKGLPNSISHLKHLHYLDLSGTKIDRLPESVSSLCNLQRLGLRSCKNLKGLPDSISHLKHLRYLDLSGTKIDRLPESVTSLCNLQTLDLEFCRSLKGLPKGITNLVNLRLVRTFGLWDRPSLCEELEN